MYVVYARVRAGQARCIAIMARARAHIYCSGLYVLLLPVLDFIFV